MSELEELIEKSVSDAKLNSKKCFELIDECGLAEALEFCESQGIAPPQCSLTANSANAENLRAKARRMLCEEKWWKQRLEKKALQDFDHAQRMNGKFNVVSDEVMQYKSRKKR